MKKLFFITSIFSFLFSGQLSAQCDLYLDYGSIKSYEMTSYDTKDKVTGRSVMNVKEYNSQSNGFMTTIQTLSYDKKNKEMGDHTFSMKCEDGVVYIDMKDWVPASSMESVKNMEMEISGDNIQIPQNLKVGKILPDANMTARAKEQTVGAMNVNFSVTNRIVEAKEQVTTTLGVFETFKVSYLMKVETEMMGIKVPLTFKGIDYYAEGYGVVKSESFNKSGKLIGYTLLTNVEK